MALISLLFGPVRWLLSGLRLFVWAKPRLNKVRRQAISYRAMNEELPQAVAFELQEREHQAAAGWLRIVGTWAAVITICAGVFFVQWRNNDAAKDQAKLIASFLRQEMFRAVKSANQWKENFEALDADYKELANAGSKASAEREKKIVSRTQTKVERAKRAAALPPTTVVDVADWLRVESASTNSGDGADGVQPSANAGGL